MINTHRKIRSIHSCISDQSFDLTRIIVSHEEPGMAPRYTHPLRQKIRKSIHAVLYESVVHIRSVCLNKLKQELS